MMHGGYGGGYGPGNMGGYHGAMRWPGYGPGMMMGSSGCRMGAGYGQGYPHGYGPGYGPGMMRGGYGHRHGHGMRGGGYGPGPMMDGYGQRYHGGPGNYGGRVTVTLSTDNVKDYFERLIATEGNPRLKVGDVKEKDADTIVAEIVTKDNSLVQRFAVNRHSGFYRQEEE